MGTPVTILAAPPTIDLPRIFRRAAQVISTNGLAKGAFVAPPAIPDACGELHASDESQRPVDMTGAIRIACGMLPTESGGYLATEAIRFASQNLAAGEAPWTDGSPDYVEHLADYTDLTACTADDVIAKFLRLSVEAVVVAELAA